MDKIFLKELTTETVIGIFDWEREVKQTIAIDLEMAADIRRAGDGWPLSIPGGGGGGGLTVHTTSKCRVSDRVA